jgi:hypothetical protein
MLFQQVRYSHDIAILLQPCVVNLLTFLLYHECMYQTLLEQPCNKKTQLCSQAVDKLVPSCCNLFGTSC